MSRVLALLLLVCVTLAAFTAAEKLLDHVNTLAGSDSKYDFSRGSTIPMVTRPWGATAWVPQTNVDNDMWWFHPRERMFYGMRCTHQPSPWINDYGQFLVQATLPHTQCTGCDGGKNFASGYNPKSKDTSFSPAYFKTKLLAFDTSVEFTAGVHASIMRLKFPETAAVVVDTRGTPSSVAGPDMTRRVSIVLNGGEDFSEIKSEAADGDGNGDRDGGVHITGYSTKNSGGVPSSIPFKHYFAVGIYGGKNGDKPVVAKATHANNEWAYADFADDVSELTVRVGTSFISVEQALLNLSREAGTGVALEQLRMDTEHAWEAQLSKMTIDAVGDAYSAHEQQGMKEVFYTASYRASIFPRQLSEVDAGGNVVHWSPYTKTADPANPTNVFPGPISTDSGFWDAYTTIYPLHSLANLDILGPKMLQGWLNAYKEGGWIPKWASPGYRQGMVGTMADVSFADAIVKDIPGVDQDLAYEAIRKDAFQSPPVGEQGIGRVCLDGYIEHGFIPNDSPMTTGGNCYEVTSRTLNYQQADWATAQAAKKLGKLDDFHTLSQRAGNFSLVFDGASTGGFFRSKNSEGKYAKEFDSIAWGGDYTEAGPHQYRFYVPWDPQALKKVYAKAGLDMCEELVNTMTMSSAFHIGNYGSEIHEQTEMAANCFGQFEFNNQPVHYMLYMFGGYDIDDSNNKAAPSYTQACSQQGHKYLRRTLQELYQPGLDMFPGDEDNGQMSAWYLLSSMGLYNLSPGSPFYALGSPLHEQVTVSISAGVKLQITALNQGPANVYVHAVHFNGELLTQGQIAYTELIKGGRLQFTMSDTAAKTA